MRKIYLNSRKYAKMGALLINLIMILCLAPMIYANYVGTEIGYLWILPILAFGLILLIGKSRFLYLILERTDESTVTFYNNFFGKRLNVREHPIDSIEGIKTFQDQKKYYTTELTLNDGQSIRLGRFPAKSQSEPFEKVANELISN